MRALAGFFCRIQIQPDILYEHPYMDFYPGDEYVDWWSISEFAIYHFRSPGSIEFYENAASRNKPVFIGESAPWMGGETIMSSRDSAILQESLDLFPDLARHYQQWLASPRFIHAREAR